MISAFIEDEKTLSRLNYIIEEENRHVEVLEDFLFEENLGLAI
jgi:hypothetical protein